MLRVENPIREQLQTAWLNALQLSFATTGKYAYQGSEKEQELSDNDYYTHFRGLDVDIARWKEVDPVFTAHESPYVSMGNNPVMLNDVLGNTVEDWFKNLKTGEVKYDPMVSGKKGDEVSLKGSSDTWQNIGKENDPDAKKAYNTSKGLTPIGTISSSGALASDYTFDGGAVLGKVAVNLLKPVVSPIFGAVAKYFGFGEEIAAKRVFSSFNNLDDLAGLFKGKNLSNAADDLLNSGWTKVEGDWGSKTIFQKQIGKERFYATWESANMEHSINSLPTSYWKLTKGKISAYGDNVRRVSDAVNFKQ